VGAQGGGANLRRADRVEQGDRLRRGEAHVVAEDRLVPPLATRGVGEDARLGAAHEDFSGAGVPTCEHGGVVLAVDLAVQVQLGRQLADPLARPLARLRVVVLAAFGDGFDPVARVPAPDLRHSHHTLLSNGSGSCIGRTAQFPVCRAVVVVVVGALLGGLGAARPRRGLTGAVAVLQSGVGRGMSSKSSGPSRRSTALDGQGVRIVVAARRPIGGAQLLLAALLQRQLLGIDGDPAPVRRELDLEVAARLGLELSDATRRLGEQLVRDEAGAKEAGNRLLPQDTGQRRQVHVGVQRVAAAQQLYAVGDGTGLLGDCGQRKHRDEHAKGMRRLALPALLGHVAGRRRQQAVGEADLADEVLAVLGPVERRRLVAERDRLEQVAGEQRRRPGVGPVILVVWSVLSGSHCSLSFTDLEPYDRGTTALSVDRAGAGHGDNVVVLAQRREAAEHLRAHRLHVLGPEAPDPAREPDGLQKTALLPAANRVLVDPQRSGGLADLHQLCHAVRVGHKGENVNMGEMVDFAASPPCSRCKTVSAWTVNAMAGTQINSSP